MNFKNYTPFAPMVFASRDPKQKDFGVLVLQGVFDMVHQAPLKPLEAQEPVVVADEYWGEPGLSSIKKENAIAPFKPKTDIHIHGTAYAPHQTPAPHWSVGVKLGQIEKKLLITGPRCWEKGLVSGYTLLDPAPIQKLPLQYEYAYGGMHGEGEAVDAYMPNPVGMGYPGSKPEGSVIAAPQIVSLDELKMDFGQSYLPQGFGPLAPAWLPRADFAGTSYMVWETPRWPDLPADFASQFYNSAHPDLIYPGFVEGNERIELRNLTPEGRLVTCLPAYQFGLLVRYQDGEIRPLPMMLDTVALETDELKARLTWRGIFSVEKEIRVLEARMRMGQPAFKSKTESALTV